MIYVIKFVGFVVASSLAILNIAMLGFYIQLVLYTAYLS